MSRIETLKKQFPNLTISLFDVLTEIDGTKTHKYLQLLCKLFNKSLELESDTYEKDMHGDITDVLNNLSIPIDEDFSTNYIKRKMIDNVRHSDVELFQTFKSYMEKGLIKENDITKYSSFSQISSAVSLAELKENEKLLQLKSHRDYEDDKWLFIRPLSFESSSKYGAGTKWCTTYKREKEYFFKYLQNGILIYIINKYTGEKYAMFTDLTTLKPETSFWDVDDRRFDITDLEIDLYLIQEIKKIKSKAKKNIEFLTKLEIFQLATECSCIYRIEGYSLNTKCDNEPTYTAEEPIPVHHNTHRFHDIPQAG